MDYSLNKVKCKGIILSESYKSQNYIEMINTLANELENSRPGDLNSKRLPALKIVIVISQKEYKLSSFINKNCKKVLFLNLTVVVFHFFN